MNISYSGKRPELMPDQQRKLDSKWDRLAKLIEWKGQRELHVVITSERHLTNVEITCNFYDHPLVVVGSSDDYFIAAQTALEKLEKQALKVRNKFRDTKRTPKDKSAESNPEIAAAEPGANSTEDVEKVTRIFRVNHHEHRKPMTLDEAILEIDARQYIVYRDSEKDCVSVLIRRPDGDFDLIES
jgi:putative sigma-54 modulation protein